METKKIVLASASPRRRELLEKAGVSFEVMTGNGEENITKTKPSEIVETLSRDKVLQVIDRLSLETGTVVIGADTVVVFEDKILGKPSDKKDAEETLKKLQGNTHQVYTGVTLAFYRENKWQYHSFSECTDVAFYEVKEEEIRAYVETGEPMDKAGSYGIQGLWGIYVKGIHGDYNNVVGLPVSRLFYEAGSLGIDLRG